MKQTDSNQHTQGCIDINSTGIKVMKLYQYIMIKIIMQRSTATHNMVL